MPGMHAAVPGFTLPRIDGPPVSLDELLHDGPLVLVFAHADCPTSALTLRRLARLEHGSRLVYIFEEAPENAARLARRTGVAATVLAETPPYEVSRAYAVETVPTAIRIDGEGGIVGRAGRPAGRRLGGAGGLPAGLLSARGGGGRGSARSRFHRPRSGRDDAARRTDRRGQRPRP